MDHHTKSILVGNVSDWPSPCLSLLLTASITLPLWAPFIPMPSWWWLQERSRLYYSYILKFSPLYLCANCTNWIRWLRETTISSLQWPGTVLCVNSELEFRISTPLHVLHPTWCTLYFLKCGFVSRSSSEELQSDLDVRSLWIRSNSPETQCTQIAVTIFRALFIFVHFVPNQIYDSRSDHDHRLCCCHIFFDCHESRTWAHSNHTHDSCHRTKPRCRMLQWFIRSVLCLYFVNTMCAPNESDSGLCRVTKWCDYECLWCDQLLDTFCISLSLTFYNRYYQLCCSCCDLRYVTICGMTCNFAILHFVLSRSWYDGELMWWTHMVNTPKTHKIGFDDVVICVPSKRQTKRNVN